MKIIFMGTPDFAVASLKTLLNSKHHLLAVVTAPDKPKGRGQKLAQSAVKQFALNCSFPILQPENLKDPGFLERLTIFKADLFVVVAFRVLPNEVFCLPPFGTINLHASLLPKYRGAAPIQWAIIKGEIETGVSTFYIDENIDTGNVLLQRPVKIPLMSTAGDLYQILKEIGAAVLLETIDRLEACAIQPKPQAGTPSPAPKITKNMCRIDWEKPAEEIVNLVRGLAPLPGAFTEVREKIIKIYRVELVTESNAYQPGKVYDTDPGSGPVIGTGRGAVKLISIQPEGKKIMTGAEFLRGYSLPVETVLN